MRKYGGGDGKWGKTLDLVGKLQLLRKALGGDEHAKADVFNTLGEDFVKDALSKTPIGAIGASIVMGIANHSSGIGNWIAITITEARKNMSCRCCFIDFYEHQNGEVWTTGSHKCLRYGVRNTSEALYVEKIIPPAEGSDKFFATVYKMFIQHEKKHWVKCQ